MKPVGPRGPTTIGIDVSHWQKHLDFGVAKESGVEFAFIKATEGAKFRDAMYLTHKQNAKKAGLIVGSYHFFRPASEPRRQAEHFYEVAGPRVKNELPPVIDLEDADGLDGKMVLSNALIFVNAIELKYGRAPIIYTGPYFFQSLRNKDIAQQFERYPLWIAHYGAKAPLTPSPWNNWTFWQYTDNHRIPGHGAGVDANHFNGTLQELKDYVR